MSTIGFGRFRASGVVLQVRKRAQSTVRALVTTLRYPYGQPTPPELRARSIWRLTSRKYQNYSGKSEKSENCSNENHTIFHDFHSPIFSDFSNFLECYWNFRLVSLQLDLARSSGGVGWPYGYHNVITSAHTVDCARFRTCTTPPDARNRPNLIVDRKNPGSWPLKKTTAIS